MPPQPAKAITSYFAKVPTSPGASKAITKSISTSTPTKSSAKDGGELKHDSARTSTPAAGPSSSPSVTGSAGTKRGFLSDAARKAIEEGIQDGSSSKKLKGAEGSAQPVADVFLKATQPKAIPIPKASSRSELKSLIQEKNPKAMGLVETELDHMAEDWLLALQDELVKPYFLKLKEFVTAEQKQKKIFPPTAEVHSWSTLCPLKDVRVVIVGQDPYHDDNQAHGLAFSVRKGIRIPPSLRNIYKELADEVPGFKIPKHGDLTEWAKHGVLLLNTSLTVRAHEAGSHSNKGWETFTAAVLKVVTSRLSPTKTEGHVPGGEGVVFMAWGAHAQKMCAGVDKNKHLILKSAHPSPLAASRGFFGNKHFKLANEWLEQRYGESGGIDWAALGEQ